MGGGTFLPLQTKNIRDHPIHAEQFSINREILSALQQRSYVVSVGTTSCRSLESIYWYGCMLKEHPEAALKIPAFVYQSTTTTSVEEALNRVSDRLQQAPREQLSGFTSLYIVPGYRPRLVDALVTNFHQPRSTLLVLLAALIGSKWREVYRVAISKSYRFLSYGDACLFHLKTTK